MDDTIFSQLAKEMGLTSSQATKELEGKPDDSATFSWGYHLPDTLLENWHTLSLRERAIAKLLADEICSLNEYRDHE